MSTRKKSSTKSRAKKLAANPLAVPKAAPASKAERLERQKALPVSFFVKGKPVASLEHHLDPAKPTLGFDELTKEQWRQLAAKRIRAQEKFELAVPGHKQLSRRQAAREVANGTPLGEILTLIEMRQIRAEAADFVSKKTRKGRSGQRRPLRDH
jgi:hypothetical protein